MEQAEAAERSQANTVSPVNTARARGCAWNVDNDTLGVRPVDARVPSTKRGLVQAIGRLFDLLGLVSPFNLQVKLLIQRLWAENYDWDGELVGDERRTWTKRRKELTALEQLQFPRCLGSVEGDDSYRRELHLFCDASQDAFTAVAYITTVTSDGGVMSSLVMSKTRVAPLRQISIVRLELQAAVLGVA